MEELPFCDAAPGGSWLLPCLGHCFEAFGETKGRDWWLAPREKTKAKGHKESSAGEKGREWRGGDITEVGGALCIGTKARKAEIRLRQPSQVCSPQDGPARGPRAAEEEVQTQGEDLHAPDDGRPLSSYGEFSESLGGGRWEEAELSRRDKGRRPSC